MVSSTCIWPILCPHLVVGITKGAWLMFSMPPATMISASPARMAWVAEITASMPEPHSTFTVTAGVY